MLKKVFSQKTLVSTVASILLSACGGGDAAFVNEDIGGFLGPGNKELDKQPSQDAPIGKFLVNDAIPGSDKTLSQLGQQNSPSVGLIDQDKSKNNTAADVVRYNQVSYISSACLFGECGTPAEAYKKKVAAEIETLETLKKNLSSTPSEGTGTGTNNNANQAQILDIDRRIQTLKHRIPDGGVYAFVDVDGKMAVVGNLTIDTNRETLNQILHNAGLQVDAGISKIDKERIGNNLVSHGGTIGRRFNGIMLIYDLETGKLRPAYLRTNISDGWSYQTFLRYYSTDTDRILQKNRDLLQGYQSIGQPTIEMPQRGWANYSGIAHALYNGQQVTMENNIHADFMKRSLEYKTNGTPYLHTFENGEHIIEKRPDMSLSGNASWTKGHSDFVGRIRSANGAEGRLEGRFYGPQALEIGGVFGIDSTVDGQTVQYIGGYGAKR